MRSFRDFMKVVTTLSQDEFVEQFPHPILMFTEQPGALDGFVHTQLTEPSEGVERIDRFSSMLLGFHIVLPNPKPSADFPRKAFVGRDPRRDFYIPHSTVSTRHACLFLDDADDAYKLVDSSSTNGTHLRGRELKAGEPVRIFDGDVITFGMVDCLFFSSEGAYRFMRQYRLFRQVMNRD